MKLLWLDDYERHARLAPGFLVILPLAIAAIGTGFGDYPFTTTAVGAVVALGGPVALASIIREKGVALQDHLFEEWGGPPTTQLLRATGRRSDPDVDRRRSAVEAAVGVGLPTAADEAADGTEADARYEAAVRELRGRTYSHTDYPLVYAENRSYGFARNTLAMRPWGIVTSLLGIGMALAVALLGGADSSGPALAVLVCLLCAIGWWFLPTDDWVQRSALRYANQLIAAASGLSKT